MFLSENFGEITAAALTNQQLEVLLDAFKSWGWKPKTAKRSATEDETITALRHRVTEYAEQIPGGQRRVQAAQKGISISEISKRLNIPYRSAFRTVENKTPFFLTPNWLRVGKMLGFTKKTDRSKDSCGTPSRQPDL